jgi:hypothetical protein
MPPKRKPVAGEATGFKNIEKLRGEFDGLENSPNLLDLQAIRIRQRHGLTWPVARAVAELHFGRAA